MRKSLSNDSSSIQGNSAILVKAYTLSNGSDQSEGDGLHFKEERFDENLRCTTLDKKNGHFDVGRVNGLVQC